MIDLDEQSLTLIKQLLQQYLPGAEVRAFGSRVSGVPKPHSDLDLVIMGKTKTPIEQLNALRFAFSNSDLAIMVDVVDWQDISEAFQERIQAQSEVLVKS